MTYPENGRIPPGALAVQKFEEKGRPFSLHTLKSRTFTTAPSSSSIDEIIISDPQLVTCDRDEIVLLPFNRLSGSDIVKHADHPCRMSILRGDYPDRLSFRAATGKRRSGKTKSVGVQAAILHYSSGERRQFTITIAPGPDQIHFRFTWRFSEARRSSLDGGEG
jgi:hypothetical protein